jgi:hypothetical protein
LDLSNGSGFEHPTRTELLPEFRILRVVIARAFPLGIEVLEVAGELVEAVGGGQVLVLIAEVVLTGLDRHIAMRLEQVGDRRRPVGDIVGEPGMPVVSTPR